MLWLLIAWLAAADVGAQTADQEYWKRKPELIRRATSGLGDPNVDIRLQATYDLAQLAPERDTDPAPEGLLTLALPALAKASREDPDSRVREGALYAIGDFGPRAASAVPALTASLADADPRVRQAAATALGSLRQASRSAIPALSRLLYDTTPHVRWATVVALGSIGSRAALPHLRHAVKDPDPGVRRAAENALAVLESNVQEER